MIDISPPVSPSSPVWPGDTVYTAEVHWPMTGGSPVMVHRFTSTPHVGAHADAPAHFLPDGDSIDNVPLEPYLGPCQVIHCLPGEDPRSSVTLTDVMTALTPTPGPVPPRLLIRSYPVFPTVWVEGFPGIAPEVLDWFARGGRAADRHRHRLAGPDA